jgi:hypothetical protein
LNIQDYILLKVLNVKSRKGRFSLPGEYRKRPVSAFRHFSMTFALVTGLVYPLTAGFDQCRFHFGMSWKGNDYSYPEEVDYATVWAGSDEDFNVWYHGALLDACLPDGVLAGRTPAYYCYIIAFTARRDWGLQDCDVGEPNLCQQGTRFIREQKDRIIGQYEKYASGAAEIWGTETPMIWMMEPDYYQYCGSGQEGGGLTFQEAGDLMAELVAIIKKHLPNALVSMDISPWVSRLEEWFGAFQMDDFTFMNTSGGRTEADQERIRNVNPMTWRDVYELTGKPVIADDGYGVAGASIGHDDTWDVADNLNTRIQDGVIAITQANPREDWNGIISANRPLLLPPPTCSAGLFRRAQGSTIGPARLGPFLYTDGNSPVLRNLLGQAVYQVPAF